MVHAVFRLGVSGPQPCLLQKTLPSLAQLLSMLGKEAGWQRVKSVRVQRRAPPLDTGHFAKALLPPFFTYIEETIIVASYRMLRRINSC